MLESLACGMDFSLDNEAKVHMGGLAVPWFVLGWATRWGRDGRRQRAKDERLGSSNARLARNRILSRWPAHDRVWVALIIPTLLTCLHAHLPILTRSHNRHGAVGRLLSTDTEDRSLVCHLFRCCGCTPVAHNHHTQTCTNCVQEHHTVRV